MTTPTEFDPDNPKAKPPAAEPQPWKEDEDEIPSFEGMVFSSYVDPADLSGSNWNPVQPISEFPSSILKASPLTEDEILKIIRSSSPSSDPAQSFEDETAEPALDGSHPLESIEPVDPNDVDSAALGSNVQNPKHGSLYGNLADSSWIAQDWLQPVQGAPQEEFVDHTAFYTRNAPDTAPDTKKDSVLEEPVPGAQSTAHAEPVESAAATLSELQTVDQDSAPISPLSSPLASSSLHPPSTEEVIAQVANPEPIDQVISSVKDRPLFRSWYEPEPKVSNPTRIPHFGHLLILVLIAFLGLVGAILIMRGALDLHLFGVSTVEKASSDIHYTIGFMASLYLITFGLAALILPFNWPFDWRENLFAGLQWNFASARRRYRILLGAAFLCFLLAMVDEILLPGPAKAPIDKLIDSRTAAWLLFAFGVTFAPFFEEIAFRGFLLPAFCTAFDWYGEKLTGNSPPPLDPGDHPRWSLPAMILGSIATSIPFALMHAEQTAWSLGPFLLLVAVSLVLCWARLATRSLAASVVVHASYNLLLFSLMLLGTGGFRNLDKM